MTIALTGFMGCGKSTVGQTLADMLGCRFTDLDAEIVRQAGKSIPEIFASEGEAGFRKREQKALAKAIPEGGTAVIALGGGTLTVPAAADLVREKTYCIYLRTGIDTLVARLEAEADGRPLLAGEGTLREKVERMMGERADLYEKTAHDSIDTDGMSPEDIAGELIIDYL